MSQTEEKNNSGNILTYKWLTGIMVSILILIVASWVSSVQAAVSEVPLLKQQINELTTKLDRITSKLDNISGALGVPVQK